MSPTKEVRASSKELPLKHHNYRNNSTKISQWYLTLVLILLLTNLFQFRAIETRIPETWKSISRQSASTVDEGILQATGQKYPEFWEAPFAIRRYAPNARLLLPSGNRLGGSLRFENLYGIATATSVDIHQGGTKECVPSWEQDPRVAFVGHIEDPSGRHPFRLIVGDSPPETLVLAICDEGEAVFYNIIDSALILDASYQVVRP